MPVDSPLGKRKPEDDPPVDPEDVVPIVRRRGGKGLLGRGGRGLLGRGGRGRSGRGGKGMLRRTRRRVTRADGSDDEGTTESDDDAYKTPSDKEDDDDGGGDDDDGGGDDGGGDDDDGGGDDDDGGGDDGSGGSSGGKRSGKRSGKKRSGNKRARKIIDELPKTFIGEKATDWARQGGTPEKPRPPPRQAAIEAKEGIQGNANMERFMAATLVLPKSVITHYNETAKKTTEFGPDAIREGFQRRSVTIKQKVDTKISSKAVKRFREALKATRKAGNCIATMPFVRVVRDVAREMGKTNKYIEAIRFKVEALMALQEGSEQFIMQLFALASKLVQHGGRVTLLPKDIDCLDYIQTELGHRQLKPDRPCGQPSGKPRGKARGRRA